jgi:hypothetical protein
MRPYAHAKRCTPWHTCSAAPSALRELGYRRAHLLTVGHTGRTHRHTRCPHTVLRCRAVSTHPAVNALGSLLPLAPWLVMGAGVGWQVQAGRGGGADPAAAHSGAGAAPRRCAHDGDAHPLRARACGRARGCLLVDCRARWAALYTPSQTLSHLHLTHTRADTHVYRCVCVRLTT